MRKVLTTIALLATCGAVSMMLEGCKRHAVPPAQPAVRIAPHVPQPDVPGPLPIQGDDQGPVERRPSSGRRLRANPIASPAPDVQAAAAAQRRQDARLLQQQRVASQQQQNELNDEVLQVTRQQQQIQEEPRIQDAPEPPASTGLGPDAPRIQDAPGPYQGQDGQTTPRIQDAPGPAQTQPSPTSPPPQN